jgi:hypothetical protein
MYVYLYYIRLMTMYMCYLTMRRPKCYVVLTLAAVTYLKLCHIKDKNVTKLNVLTRN